MVTNLVFNIIWLQGLAAKWRVMGLARWRDITPSEAFFFFFYVQWSWTLSETAAVTLFHELYSTWQQGNSLLTHAGVSAEDAGSEQEGAMFLCYTQKKKKGFLLLLTVRRWREKTKEEYVRFKSTTHPTENKKYKNSYKKSTHLLLNLWNMLMKSRW